MISLQTKCPNCLKEIPILTRKTRNGFCSYCGCWLGSTNCKIEKLLFAQNDNQHYFAATIEKLLKAGQVSGFHYSNIDIQSFMKEIINLSGGKVAFSRALGFPKTTVRAWYEGKNRPSLNSLLKVFSNFEIDIDNLLSGQQVYTVKKDNSNPYLKIKKTSRNNHLEKIQLEFALKKIIKENNIPPLSMNKVAIKLHCNKRLLYRYFPDLCKTISQNYIHYIQKAKEQRIQEACIRVRSATMELHKQGLYPSRRRVESLLHNQILRKKPIQLAWRKTLVSLGICIQ